MGLNLGKTVFDRILSAFRSFASSRRSATIDAASDFVDAHSGWVQIAGKAFARAVGVAIAFAMGKLTAIFSACSVGSQMVVQSIEAVVDPWLVHFNLPPLKDTPGRVTAMQTSLLALGYTFQIKHSGIPLWLKLVLSPVLAFEFFLTKSVKKSNF